MSALLLDQALAYVRDAFTRAEVQTVEAYGGQFNAGEVDQVSYSCPAIFITVLGWQPGHSDNRITGRFTHEVRLAAFVAFKHAERSKRLAGAMALAERLALALRMWVPDCDALPVEIAPIEGEANAENMFSRAIDKKGQALWLVDWTQCVKPRVPLPTLFDLTAIEITDQARPGLVPASPAPAPGALVVTEDVQFPPLA